MGSLGVNHETKWCDGNEKVEGLESFLFGHEGIQNSCKIPSFVTDRLGPAGQIAHGLLSLSKIRANHVEQCLCKCLRSCLG